MVLLAGIPAKDFSLTKVCTALYLTLWLIQVGEFVEVFNESDTDPAAWLGKVHAVRNGYYVVCALLLLALQAFSTTQHTF